MPTFTPPNWYYWGAGEGRANSFGDDQTTPDIDPQAILDISAGSRHTFKVLASGEVFVSGFVESKLGYYGHMGLGEVASEKECKDPEKEFCVAAAGRWRNSLKELRKWWMPKEIR